MQKESFIVKKQNGELIFTDIRGYETRNSSTFWCIQKADEKYHCCLLYTSPSPRD